MDPRIYELAEQHIQVAHGDKTLVRQYVDAAAQLVQDLTGVPITDSGSHVEVVVPAHLIERPQIPLFSVPARDRTAIVRVQTPLDPMLVDVFTIKRGARHYIGRYQVIGGVLRLDQSDCCLDDIDAIVVRMTTLAADDWPPQVKQAVLQLAKWLYEHRGDAIERKPAEMVAASGAGQLLAGYMGT